MIRADGIIFDCDGVLVDVTNSYYMTIAVTVNHILEKFRILLPPNRAVTGSLIQSFKDTGAYNNEIDLAYSVILLEAAAYRAGLDPYDTTMNLSIHNTGIPYTEKKACEIHDISDIVEQLQYGNDDNSIVRQVFDQIFYGPSLYRDIFNIPSQFGEPGLIETENLFINDDIAGLLVERFDAKIGMVTGRGYKSASYTLGKFMKIFDVESSAFLEDEPKYMAKPNPVPLRSAIKRMNIQDCIYVGDSLEDLMMAQSVDSVTFVGVWGSSANPAKRKRTLQDNGADHTIESISDIGTLFQSG